MKDLKSRFIELKDTDKYQRVASSHPIAWYVGLDGRNRYSLFAITKTQPKNISETKLMSVFVGERVIMELHFHSWKNVILICSHIFVRT